MRKALDSDAPTEGGRALAVPAFKTEDPEQEDSLMDNPLKKSTIIVVEKLVKRHLSNR